MFYTQRTEIFHFRLLELYKFYSKCCNYLSQLGRWLKTTQSKENNYDYGDNNKILTSKFPRFVCTNLEILHFRISWSYICFCSCQSSSQNSLKILLSCVKSLCFCKMYLSERFGKASSVLGIPIAVFADVLKKLASFFIIY